MGADKVTAGEAARIVVAAPVRKATLLEDRAQVRRQGTVVLPAGRSVLVVEDVAPVLVDKTLLVDVTGLEGVRVEDSRVCRVELALRVERPEAVRELETRLLELHRTHEGQGERLGVLERRAALLDGILARTVEDLAVDAAYGRVAGAPLGAELDALGRERVEVEREALQLRFEREDTAVAVRDLETRIRVARTPSSSVRAQVEIQVEVPEGGEAGVAIEYVVPGSCWRPYHTATLKGDRVVFETDGCVWQNTGENWNDTELVFSTERPSLGTSIPRLSEDRLTAQLKEAGDAVEMREEKVQVASLDVAPRVRKAAEVPGVDDGGEVRRLQAPSPAKVPSDGRPHRIPLGRFEVAAQVELVCMPELAPCAVLRSEQANDGDQPMLAGPVDLIRSSGLAGRTKTLFVAPGETFELGWGPEAALRVNRSVDVKREEPGLLSSWGRDEHRVVTRLSNLGADDLKVKLQERVPVSEIDTVKVAVDQGASTPGLTGPDKDGLLSWLTKVPAGGTATVRLVWKLEKHKSVTGL